MTFPSPTPLRSRRRLCSIPQSRFPIGQSNPESNHHDIIRRLIPEIIVNRNSTSVSIKKILSNDPWSVSVVFNQFSLENNQQILPNLCKQILAFVAYADSGAHVIINSLLLNTAPCIFAIKSYNSWFSAVNRLSNVDVLPLYCGIVCSTYTFKSSVEWICCLLCCMC